MFDPSDLDPSGLDAGDLDAAERRIDDWQAGFEERAAQARELAARLAELTTTARSEDGLVEVTVGASGAMIGLELAEETRRQPADKTAREILRTLSAAQSAMTEAATEATAETIGAETETGRAVIASFTARQRS